MAILRIASYNIHGAIGRDGWCSPARIRDVLVEIGADIVALQEVEARASGIDMLGWLAEALGLTCVAGPTLLRADGHYGNGLLTCGSVLATEMLDLSMPGREPRGAITAEVECRGVRLCVVATHLGLAPAERRQQIRQLIRHFGVYHPDTPAVLAGDLNEWFLWGRPLKWLHDHFEQTPARATFPARLPMFALDRIWVSPRSILRRVRAHRSPLARVASDHLPVVGTIELPG